MARKTRIQLNTISCRGGCGKQVTTINRSIHDLDSLHKQYAGYCDKCLPLSEDELLRLQGLGIVKNFAQ